MLMHPLFGELVASNPSNNTFHISGAFQNAADSSISFDISSDSGATAGLATVTFPAPDTAMLAIVDTRTHLQFNCANPKSKLNPVQLYCTLPTGHTFSVEGVVSVLSQ